MYSSYSQTPASSSKEGPARPMVKKNTKKTKKKKSKKKVEKTTKTIITQEMRKKISQHAVVHTVAHMRVMMTKLQQGVSFNTAHKLAESAVGK